MLERKSKRKQKKWLHSRKFVFIYLFNLKFVLLFLFILKSEYVNLKCKNVFFFTWILFFILIEFKKISDVTFSAVKIYQLTDSADKPYTIIKLHKFLFIKILLFLNFYRLKNLKTWLESGEDFKDPIQLYFSIRLIFNKLWVFNFIQVVWVKSSSQIYRLKIYFD